MTEHADSVGHQLRAALVAAFPGYLRRRLADIGIVDDDALSGIIVAATEQLSASLAQQVLADPPLELVRRATEPVTDALLDRNVVPVARDERSVEIHPDDVFDLYPATSRDLGEDAWRVHMEWGIEQARVRAGLVPSDSAVPSQSDSAARSRAISTRVPRLALFGFSPDLRADLNDAAAALSHRTIVWRNPGALAEGVADRPVLTLVDLGHPSSDDAIRAIREAGLRCVAAGDGVDDFTQAAMMALGAEEVVELDRIVERLPDLLPRLA
ncbi:MAG: hypothetical protein QNJ77_05305 [Acidimicrobiia bacterium]|nr:hypothetical protein [Acidimicrobiia bacterium]